jgi:hypothetical protein
MEDCSYLACGFQGIFLMRFPPATPWRNAVNSVDLDGSKNDFLESFVASQVADPSGFKRSDAAKPSLRAKEQSSGNDSKKLSIVLGKEMHRRAKMQALKEDITLKQLVVRLLERHLDD